MIDATGVYNFNAMLKHFIHMKKQIILSGVNDNVRAELEKHDIVNLVGKNNVCSSFDTALEIARNKAKVG